MMWPAIRSPSRGEVTGQVAMDSSKDIRRVGTFRSGLLVWVMSVRVSPPARLTGLMVEYLRETLKSSIPWGGGAWGRKPSRQRRPRGRRRRRAILGAAIDRFGRDGFRATSVADIARDAGVGGTVAYAYFPNKEALFLAAVDEDAAAVIQEGLATGSTARHPALARHAICTLVGALARHPLARRLLAGLEPEVTVRVLDIPALTELRKACAELLRTGQAEGTVRPDIDPTAIANGIVALMLSVLMSVTQLGREAAVAYSPGRGRGLRGRADRSRRHPGDVSLRADPPRGPAGPVARGRAGPPTADP